jgi:predicted amino acid-binding ACT domain protein
LLVARAFLAKGDNSGSTKTETRIIHVAGLDQLKIVSDVTGVVIDAGGNVGTSVAGRLGPSYFSLMMLVDGVPAAHVASLQARIRALPDLESAKFSVNPVKKLHPPPLVGCTCQESGAILLGLLPFLTQLNLFQTREISL